MQSTYQSQQGLLKTEYVYDGDKVYNHAIKRIADSRACPGPSMLGSFQFQICQLFNCCPPLRPMWNWTHRRVEALRTERQYQGYTDAERMECLVKELPDAILECLTAAAA